MKKLLITTIFLTLTTTHTFANCETGSKTVFSCLTAKSKRIEVCDSGKTIQYAFGPLDKKPEILLNVPRDQASTSQWQGFGRDHTYTVDIPNGATTYSAFWSVDSLSPDHKIDAGVNVMKNNDLIATVNCSPRSKIISNIEGINLKPSE